MLSWHSPARWGSKTRIYRHPNPCIRTCRPDPSCPTREQEKLRRARTAMRWWNVVSSCVADCLCNALCVKLKTPSRMLPRARGVFPPALLPFCCLLLFSGRLSGLSASHCSRVRLEGGYICGTSLFSTFFRDDAYNQVGVLFCGAYRICFVCIFGAQATGLCLFVSYPCDILRLTSCVSCSLRCWPNAREL